MVTKTPTCDKNSLGIAWRSSAANTLSVMLRSSSSLLFLSIVCFAGCGGDANSPDTSRTNSVDGSDAGAMDGPSETPDPSDDDPDSPPLNLPQPNVDDIESPPPLLPDTDRDTEINDLSDEEFEELCEPFLDGAGSALGNANGLCGLQGISAASEANAATVEEYQRACGMARLECEAALAAVDTLFQEVECSRPEDCTATVEQIDACYQRLYLLNEAILAPLDGVDIPACEDLTPAQGATIGVQLLLYLNGTTSDVATATGSSVEQLGDPCAELETLCPDFAVPEGLPTAF